MQFSAQTKLLRYRHRHRCRRRQCAAATVNVVVVAVLCIKENLFLVQFIFSRFRCLLQCTLFLYYSYSLTWAILCAQPKTMFVRKTYTIFEWKHASEIMLQRFHVLFSMSVLPSPRYRCLLACLPFKHTVCVFYLVCSSKTHTEWRHLKNGSFEYLLRLCGERTESAQW